MSHYGRSTVPTKSVSWNEIIEDVRSGVITGASHSLWFVKDWAKQSVIRPGLRALGLEAGDDVNVNDEDNLGLKVVGVGYGRTGTYSLSVALDELGFPTLHTQHLYENHEIFDMWANEIFRPAIEADEVRMGSPNFDLIAAKGFQGTMDLPMALYFEQVMEKYPDSKFILTTRDNSEVWFRSWDMLSQTITKPTQYWQFMAHVQRLNDYLRWLFSVVNKDKKYLNCPMPFPDQMKEQAISSYEEHNRRVREVIPPERLLEYNVKQGWEPLCKFLEVADCPTTPFPKSNSARSLQVQTISAMAIPLTITLFIVFYLFSYVFERITERTILEWLSMKRIQFLEYMTGCEMKVQKRRAALAKKRS